MSEDEHRTVAAEDGTHDVVCPVCDTDFDSTEWETRGVAGDAWGGSAYHECPTESCPGTVTVLY